jgi:hypothetical protein
MAAHGSGLVPHLSRPGGNATGFMQFEYGLRQPKDSVLCITTATISVIPSSDGNVRGCGQNPKQFWPEAGCVQPYDSPGPRHSSRIRVGHADRACDLEIAGHQ